MFCAVSLPVLGGILLFALAVAALTYKRTHSVGAVILAGVLALIVGALALLLFFWLRRPTTTP